MAAVRKLISFTDLDGKPVSEEWWFQLGKTDALELDIVHEDNPEEYLKKILDDKDSRKLLKVWKELLFAAVGVRVDSQLVKNDEVLARFKQGGAYEQFFSELIESEDAGASFFAAILPDDVRDQAAKQAANPTYTDQQLLDMDDEAFYAAAGTSDLKKMDKRFTTLAMRRLSASRLAQAS